MNDLKIFESEAFGKIRVLEKDGEPWFVAADVCRALELDRTQSRRLDDDEKGVFNTHPWRAARNVGSQRTWPVRPGAGQPEARGQGL